VHQVEAVLLDLGGVFYLPDHERVLTALARVDLAIERERLDEAHYRGIAAIDDFRDGDRSVWHAYNRAYAQMCGVAPDDLADAAEVLLAEFDAGGAWTRVIPGSVDALRALHDLGVGLAVVSNADGTVEEQLRLDEICQVGPGPGVPVEAILDSSVVGVSKPDPAIFRLALEALGVDAAHAIHVGDTPAADVEGAWAAGVTPVLVDPYGLHPSVECAHVASMAEVPALLQSRR
jgi:putative hydrolase of the HAD superfamily